MVFFLVLLQLLLHRLIFSSQPFVLSLEIKTYSKMLYMKDNSQPG